ncbi:hypothetical protein V8C43DRAFT_210055 [Trichoderma afarasin]
MHHSYGTRATTTCELRVYASAPLLFLSPALCCILLRFRHMQGGLSFNRTASFTLHFVFVFFSLLSKLCCMLRTCTQPANGISPVYFPIGTLAASFSSFFLQITITC